MKKGIFVLGLASLLLSCGNNNGDTNVDTAFKTAYIDSSKLMTEYQEVKDIESKYKIKSEEKGKQFESEIAKFQQDVQSFQANAAQKGQEWAQQKGAELQRREQQLQMKQQALFQELQSESSTEMDSVVKKVKGFISDYAKKNNLDYVFNTEEASTVIYAKDQYNITEEVIKELNAKYSGNAAATNIDSAKTTEKEEK